VELRAILADATDFTEQTHGTFIVVSNHENQRWEVVVVPDFEKKMIVVVSAYPLP